MTSLIEKSLLIGFGIFCLIIFLITIIPPYYEALEYQDETEDDKDNLKKIHEFIEEFNQILNNLISELNFPYFQRITYPDNLNMEFTENQVMYELSITESIFYKIYEYNVSFIERCYNFLTPNSYLLNISLVFEKLDVKFLEIS